MERSRHILVLQAVGGCALSPLLALQIQDGNKEAPRDLPTTGVCLLPCSFLLKKGWVSLHASGPPFSGLSFQWCPFQVGLKGILSDNCTCGFREAAGGQGGAWPGSSESRLTARLWALFVFLLWPKSWVAAVILAFTFGGQRRGREPVWVWPIASLFGAHACPVFATSEKARGESKKDRIRAHGMICLAHPQITP